MDQKENRSIEPSSDVHDLSALGGQEAEVGREESPIFCGLTVGRFQRTASETQRREHRGQKGVRGHTERLLEAHFPAERVARAPRRRRRAGTSRRSAPRPRGCPRPTKASRLLDGLLDLGLRQGPAALGDLLRHGGAPVGLGEDELRERQRQPPRRSRPAGATSAAPRSKRTCAPATETRRRAARGRTRRSVLHGRRDGRLAHARQRGRGYGDPAGALRSRSFSANAARDSIVGGGSLSVGIPSMRTLFHSRMSAIALWYADTAFR